MPTDRVLPDRVPRDRVLDDGVPRDAAPSDVDGAPSRGLPGLAASVVTGVRTALSPRVLAGLGTEAAWLVAHGLLYPLGALAERTRERARDELDRFTLDDLPALQRGLVRGDVVAAGTPIVLVHGLVDNRSIFTVLSRALRRRGFARVLTFVYSPLTQDVRAAAALLGELVERTVEETGYERVHLVGHSLGGVVARYYVQRLGGDARVHTVCTLGSPHGGTLAAHLLPSRLVRQLRPGSDLVEELAEPAPGCRTRFLAVWSDLDQVVVPQRLARIDHPDLHARNVLLPGVGHMSLPIDGRVAHEIVQLLAHLDTERGPAGGTVRSLPDRTAGASRLPRSAPGTA